MFALVAGFVSIVISEVARRAHPLDPSKLLPLPGTGIALLPAMLQKQRVSLARANEPGRGFHSSGSSGTPEPTADTSRPPRWRHLSAFALALLTVPLCIPSAGCIGDLMCSEMCFGSVGCERFAPSDCGSHDGCSVGDICGCAAAGCTEDTRHACQRFTTADSCSGAGAACTWLIGTCFGSTHCSDLHENAESCNADSQCRWERNCN